MKKGNKIHIWTMHRHTHVHSLRGASIRAGGDGFDKLRSNNEMKKKIFVGAFLPPIVPHKHR